jgi:sugar phosphate isomerase/epimerase
MYISIHPDAPQQRNMDQALAVLETGGVIIYPTDTIYGIGCNINEQKAIDRVAEAIDLAIVDRRPTAVFIHGFGTGALRSAVRDYLKRSPYVERFVAGDTESDTDGVTTAELRGRS